MNYDQKSVDDKKFKEELIQPSTMKEIIERQRLRTVFAPSDSKFEQISSGKNHGEEIQPSTMEEIIERQRRRKVFKPAD